MKKKQVSNPTGNEDIRGAERGKERGAGFCCITLALKRNNLSRAVLAGGCKQKAKLTQKAEFGCTLQQCH